MNRKKILSFLPKVLASLTSLSFLLAYFYLDAERWVRMLLMDAAVFCSVSLSILECFQTWKTERTRSSKWKIIAYLVFISFLCILSAYTILTRP